MLGAIQAAREEEYGEITADARRLLAQLNWEERQETAPPDAARYALECRRLRRRLAVAAAHDFFGAAGGEEAEAAIAAVETRLSPETVKPPASRPARPASQVRPMPKTPRTSAGEARSTPGGGRDAAADSRRADMPVFLF